MNSYVFASEELVTLPRVRPVRLRSIEADYVSGLRELFRREVVRSDGAGLTWRLHWLRTRNTGRGVILRGESAALVLNVREDGLREPLGCREWWDYEEEARLLAWTLAHATLLESLARLLGDAFLPDGWTDFSDPAGAANAVLEFRVSASDGRAAAGELALPAEMVAKVAERSQWAGEAPGLEPWGRLLTAQLCVRLPATPFPRREALAARVGDVLVLGPAAGFWRRLVLIYPVPAFSGAGPDTRWTWRARYEAGRLEVVTPPLDEPTRTFMSEPIAEESGAAVRVNTLEGVPVTLDFEVGSLAMPLGELAALKPGYVFELPARLEESRVIVKANGTPIGRGELVMVADTLGVQLLSIDAHGFR